MKKLLLTLLLVPTLALAQKTPQGVTYDAQIVRVNDGDTVVIAAPFLPAPLKPELAVRVFGVDTPEKGHRAQCAKEAAAAELASAYTKDVLGDITVDGQSIRAGLIKNGHAREYYGEAKQSWCN